MLVGQKITNNNEAIEDSNFVTSPLVLANALVHRELCIMGRMHDAVVSTSPRLKSTYA